MEMTEQQRRSFRADYRLSPRELELVGWLLRGDCSDAALAQRMAVRRGTAARYLHDVYAKVRVGSKAGLVVAVCDYLGAFDHEHDGSLHSGS